MEKDQGERRGTENKQRTPSALLPVCGGSHENGPTGCYVLTHS